ncbi:MAG TPA: 1,4-dihydroxy-2-naphthoate octaprenyltransferase, partial [Syntrophales bacterium]|nr:1,4-dihydroxy-2-naphthoate octaprenyltransferase [Syntrophales bacterium]
VPSRGMSSGDGGDRMRRHESSPWVRVMRLHFVPTSVLPALLGSVVAWDRTGLFHPGMFVLVLVGVTLNHMGINMIDDVFDYLQAADRSSEEGKNPYSGGSGVLAEGSLGHKSVLAAATASFAATALIALYLAAAVGWPVIVFAGIGIFSSVFYTAPPVRYGYRGLGEVGLLVNFGPVIVLGAYYVQAKALALEPFVLSLLPGFLMWSMIVANEIPDAENDRKAGKNTLVVRLGSKRAVALYGAGLLAAYGSLVLAVLFRAAPPGALLGLAGVPLGFRSWKILRRMYDNPREMIPVNQAIIRVHRLSCMALIVGCLIAGVF